MVAEALRPGWRRAVYMVIGTMLVAGAAANGQVRVVRRLGPVPVPPPADGTSAKRSAPSPALHLPRDRQVNFAHQMNDGAGFLWDIQYCASIGQGTNNAYGSGMYLQINGNNVPAASSGVANKEGDEIEVGPQNHAGLSISRRVRVYKDQGLARWLDIFENTSGRDVTVQARIYTCFNWAPVNLQSSSGAGTFGEKDWAFVTQVQAGGMNVPALLHVVCGPRSKLRPTVQMQHNQIYVNYPLTVPAGKTVLLCYFESQGNSLDEHIKRMAAFRPARLLRDLPASVRKLIVNFPVSGGIEDMELERSEQADTIIRSNGDPVYGTISNAQFEVETFYGRLSLPAADVIGMVVDSGQAGAVRAALKDGQVVAGTMPQGRLDLKLPAGGELSVAIDAVRQWSFRLSDARPDDVPFAGPQILLRSGDRLRFDASQVPLALLGRHGQVPLDGRYLLELRLDNPANGLHRATFLNGSNLGGILEPAQIQAPLRLGPKLSVSRDRVVRMVFAAEERPDDTLTRVVLTDDSELLGNLTDGQFRLRTDSGVATFRPSNIRTMTFSPSHLERATVTLWDGSVLRGQIEPAELAFRIVPGPELKLYVGQVVAIESSQAAPPEEVIQQVQKLVAQLGAESYKDRQTAADALKRMGKPILPLLQKHLADGDPEVRHRLEDLIESLGGTPKPPAPPEGVEQGEAVFFGPR